MAHVGDVGTEIAPAIPDDPALASRIDDLLHRTCHLAREDGQSYGLLELSDKTGGADFTEADADNIRELAAFAGATLDALRAARHS